MGEHDEEAVTTALGLRPAYLGVVASRTRFGQLRETLLGRGVSAEPLDRIRNPAGLDIGARLPEEVALSILAEIVQLARAQRRRAGGLARARGRRGAGPGVRDDGGGGHRAPPGGARRADLLLLQPALPREVPRRAGAVPHPVGSRALSPMAMEIAKTFVINAAPEAVWSFLIDLPRVARCLPGAAIGEQLDDKTSTGTMTIKVGPVSSSYQGKVVFERLDAATRTAELVATGQDVRGKGGADLRLTSSLRRRSPAERPRSPPCPW